MSNKSLTFENTLIVLFQNNSFFNCELENEEIFNRRNNSNKANKNYFVDFTNSDSLLFRRRMEFGIEEIANEKRSRFVRNCIFMFITIKRTI